MGRHAARRNMHTVPLQLTVASIGIISVLALVGVFAALS